MIRNLTPVRCLAAAGALLAMSATAASAGETRGFAISWFQPAYYVGDDDCPNGVSKERDWKALFLIARVRPAPSTNVHSPVLIVVPAEEPGMR